MRSPSTPQHFAFIDALRGWAFLGVLLVHAPGSIPALAKEAKYFSSLLSHGRYGVQLFYIVSAFTLFWSLANRSKSENHPRTNFFIRRFFRIAPLFWIALVFYCCWDGLGSRYWAPDGLSFWHILSTTLFVHGWHPTSINSVVPGGWSIAVEMNFYLLIPLCFWAITSLRKAIIAFGLTWGIQHVAANAWMAGFGNFLPAHQTYLNAAFIDFWLPRQVPVFILGFILYYLIRDSLSIPATGSARPVSESQARLRGIFLQLSAVFLVWASITWAARWVPLFWGYCLAFVLMAWGLALWPTGLLVNSFTRYMGKVSFSAYLGHFAALDLTKLLYNELFPAVPQHLSTISYFWLFTLTALALTLLIATLTFHLIEQPGQQLGKRLIRFLEQPGSEARVGQPGIAVPAIRAA